jgi:hypothetical protein
MNGATEATLAELLATAQAMNVNMIKLQGLFKNMTPGGGSSGGGSSGGTASLVSSINPVGVAFGVLKGAAGAVGSVFGVLTGILGKVISAFTNTASNLYGFAASTALGTSKLSDFYAAFKDIPILGTAFGIFSDVLKYQESLLEFFQQIAFHGANFSGSLTDMRAAASKSYMSMQDLAEVVKSNSEVFANLGGTAQSGVNRFVEIQNKMLGPKSEYGNLMAGLGYTAKGTAELLASYMKIQGTMNKEEIQSTDAIIKGTVAYAKELDTLSQLTGKSSADLRKRAEKIAAEEAFEAFKLTKDTDTVNAMNAAILNMLETGGEEAAVQLRNSFMGLNTAQSEGQRAMAVMTNNGVTELNNQVLRMVKEGKSTAEIGEAVRRGNLENGRLYTANIQRLGATGATMANNILITSGATMTKFARDQVDLSKLNVKEREARERQLKSQSSQAAALEKASQGMRDFGLQLLMTVWGVIAPMTPLLKDFAGFIVSVIVGMAKLAAEFTGSAGFKGAITSVTTWFKETAAEIKNAYNNGGFVGAFGALFNKSVEGMKKIWTTLEPVVVPVVKQAFQSIMEFLQPWFEKALSAVFDSISDYLNDKLGIGESKSARLARQKEQGTEAYASWISFMKSTAAPMFAKGMLDRNNQSELFGEYQAQLKAGFFRAPQTSPTVNQIPKKHTGTLGTTGSWWEKSNVVAEIAAGEGVFTKPQVEEYAAQNSLAQGIQQLNSLVAQQVKYAKEAAEYARRNVDATKGLNGNLFA